MNTDETITALRVRRDLTGESFNDGTVGAWTEALRPWPMPTVCSAVVAAARQHKRVAVADVVERLPQRTREAPPRHCELCDGTGWVDAPPRVWPDERTSTQVQPCRCSEGQAGARSRIWTERHHRPALEQATEPPIPELF